MKHRNLNKDEVTCPFCQCISGHKYDKKIYQLVDCAQCSKKFELYASTKIKNGDYALSYSTFEVATNKENYEIEINVKNKSCAAHTTFITDVNIVETPYRIFDLLNSDVYCVEKTLTNK